MMEDVLLASPGYSPQKDAGDLGRRRSPRTGANDYHLEASASRTGREGIAAAVAAEPEVWRLVRVKFFLEGPKVFLQEVEPEREGCWVFSPLDVHL